MFAPIKELLDRADDLLEKVETRLNTEYDESTGERATSADDLLSALTNIRDKIAELHDDIQAHFATDWDEEEEAEDDDAA